MRHDVSAWGPFDCCWQSVRLLQLVTTNRHKICPRHETPYLMFLNMRKVFMHVVSFPLPPSLVLTIINPFMRPLHYRTRAGYFYYDIFIFHTKSYFLFCFFHLHETAIVTPPYDRPIEIYTNNTEITIPSDSNIRLLASKPSSLT